MYVERTFVIPERSVPVLETLADVVIEIDIEGPCAISTSPHFTRQYVLLSVWRQGCVCFRTDMGVCVSKYMDRRSDRVSVFRRTDTGNK